MVSVSGRLAAKDYRFASWAAAVGCEWGPLPESEHRRLLSEIDALASSLYGLNQQQIVQVYETFHVGWDYSMRLEQTMSYFKLLD
jgi:hypothetical protein